MQSIQRQYGKFQTRSADDAQVGQVIADYYDADRALEKLIDAAKSWQQAWTNLLQYQTTMLITLDTIYAPIVAKDGNTMNSSYAPTPEQSQRRVTAMREAYQNLKDDMIEEVQAMQNRIIAPAKETKKMLEPYKKMLKKREDRKLDYERYQNQTDSLQSKVKRSDKQDATLAKKRLGLEGATNEYEVADQHIKNTLPRVTQLAFEILPRLLNAQILIQNTLLAHLYTAVHNFCEDHGLPSPAPETAEVVAEFEAQFTPLRREMESSIRTLSTGKAINQPMSLNHDTSSSLNVPSMRRGSSQSNTSKHSVPPADYEPPSPQPSHGQFDLASRPKIQSTYSHHNGLLSPGQIAEGARDYLHRTDAGGAPSPQGNPNEYFPPPSHIAAMKPRQSSGASSGAVTPGGTNPALGKKKPPPPPPKKKFEMKPPQDIVVAIYGFDGQGHDELSFNEGDRIIVHKRTNQEDDWWEGEVRGHRGLFPGTYVRQA